MKAEADVGGYVARLRTVLPSPATTSVREDSSPPASSGGSAVIASVSAGADVSARRGIGPRRRPGPNSGWAGVRDFALGHVKVLGAVALVAVIASTWMVLHARALPIDSGVDTVATISLPSVDPSSASPSVAVAPWLIHVLGAVKHPGVVTVPAGARVIDALTAAGGLTADADPAELNLAAELTDGAQIIIGTLDQPRGEVRIGAGPASIGGATGGSAAGATGLINLNTATAAELESLPGVGPVTVAAILAWRDQNGRFTALNQLQEVSGIGPKTFAQIEPYVTI